MTTFVRAVVSGTVLLIGCNTYAAIRYVDASNGAPATPYTSWNTAATTIQDAVDAANNGDNVLVTNGVYNAGGFNSSRLAVSKYVLIRSVNGPEVTTIEGYQVPGITNGTGAVRCVRMSSGSLSGFTLTNGATSISDYGGGIYCASASAVVSNCVIVGNTAGTSGGGAFGGTFRNCTIAGNRAVNYGGGAYNATLRDCTILSNSIEMTWSGGGGGVAECSLTNCVLAENYGFYGGGAYRSTITNCILFGNNGVIGGGAAGNSSMARSVLIGNTASGGDGSQPLPRPINCGGGADSSSLEDCIVTGNSAAKGGAVNACWQVNNCLIVSNTAGLGAASFDSVLNNCTVVANSATSASYGFSVLYSSLNNSILYHNTNASGTNVFVSILNYCATESSPTTGIGNITNEPRFVDLTAGNFRLSPSSPCINAGDNANSPSTTDLDGNIRIAGGTVDIGCYEFQSPASAISFAWLLQHELALDGSADCADDDSDGMSSWQEWRAGTNPTDALSLLKMLAPGKTESGVAVAWQSTSNRTYFLQCTHDTRIPFSTIATNIAGLEGTTFFTDTNLISDALFYRVGVQ